MKIFLPVFLIVLLAISCINQEDKKSTNSKKMNSTNQSSVNETDAMDNHNQSSVFGTRIAKNVDKEEFAALIAKKNGTVIDVRTPEEYSKGNIEGSVNIDIYDNTFMKRAKELEMDKPVYIYCQSGGRSGRAMGELKKLGFLEIYNLRGGFSDWIKE